MDIIQIITKDWSFDYLYKITLIKIAIIKLKSTN